MPLVTVRLERVFDVVHLCGEGEDSTLFSIECEGRWHVGIMLPGRLTFQDGMIVTAFLERENDWQTLRGWRDHASGELVYRSGSRMTIIMALSLVVAVAPVFPFAAAPILSGMLVLAGLVVFAVGAQYWRTGSKALKQLQKKTT
jgi:membrane glycosyltransferase